MSGCWQEKTTLRSSAIQQARYDAPRGLIIQFFSN